MSAYEKFKALHHAEEPLLLCNVWNAASAKIIQEKGFPALATSSSAVADTMGYTDGENIPFPELLQVTERIVKSVDVPVSADIETGYSSDIDGLLRNIDQLLRIGVVGINLEDAAVGESRILPPAADFVKKLSAIRTHLSATGKQLFINARTDTFLLKLPNALEETLIRARIYEEAGADSLFVPFIHNEEDIRQVVNATSLPVNVLAMPQLPSYARLKDLGVKRISMGGSMYWSLGATLRSRIDAILADGDFRAVFI
ncbi:isocitrate lyase/PEP mutase family protein [Chitinophaga solisilvae]|uniref:isocitrate lyase/PEP mutase family protein n=1 Tax=Chitinophaga solisilvae TaxID=1233460 RepID=UPI001369B7E3|nr:isocitrate lyase/phosphoenolpyruvate mutase family protein [Chitinophaga solisilvae]